MKYLPLILCLFLTACVTPTSSQKPAPIVSYGEAKGAGSAGIHTVLRGDTVYKVSRRYKLPIRDIITVNHLGAPYRLNVGYRLRLPPPNEYKVRQGDTLHSVSRIFDVSMNRVARLNNLQPPGYHLRAGQVLRLPSPTTAKKATFRAPSARDVLSAPSSNVHAPKIQTASAQQNSGTAIRPPQKPAVNKSVQKTAIKRPKITNKVPKRSGNGKFLRPVRGKLISSYGPKKSGLHNDGINIKASRGASVNAAENGVVVYAGSELQGYGNMVLIRHQDKWMSAYAHLDKMTIKRGDTIKRGMKIGTVGSTGQVDTPQLHFELRRGTKALNPQKYM